MKTKGTEEFRKELLESVRFGDAAVRITMENVLHQWNGDCTTLAELAALCEDMAFTDRENGLTATWLFLYDQVWDCARERLNQKEYHCFCKMLL